VKTDLSWFDRITPCGIKEFGITSLSRELSREVSLAEVEDKIIDRFLQKFR
jgi:lipoyl(octanoyl) transferase